MMTTMQEHTKWLAKYCDNLLIHWSSRDQWGASITLIGGEWLSVDGFSDIDECTRALCDEVCEHLGDKCNG